MKYEPISSFRRCLGHIKNLDENSEYSEVEYYFRNLLEIASNSVKNSELDNDILTKLKHTYNKDLETLSYCIDSSSYKEQLELLQKVLELDYPSGDLLILDIPGSWTMPPIVDQS